VPAVRLSPPREPIADYEQLQIALTSELAPADLIEQIWCEDVLSLVWESHRLRRVKRVMFECDIRGQWRQALERRHPTLGFNLPHEQTEADRNHPVSTAATADRRP